MSYVIAKKNDDGALYFLKQDTLSDGVVWQAEGGMFSCELSAEDITLFHNRKSAIWWLKQLTIEEDVFIQKVDITRPPTKHGEYTSEWPIGWGK